MKKGIIIAGFATVGKSILGEKYGNVIDLESSTYKYKLINDNLPVEERKGTRREINSNWPQNYYNAIAEAVFNYDIILVQLKPEHFDYFDAHHIRYSIAYPDINNWDEVEKRCIERGNNAYYITRLKEVFRPYYEDVIRRKCEKFYIIASGKNLEDALLADGIKLIN